MPLQRTVRLDRGRLRKGYMETSKETLGALQGVPRNPTTPRRTPLGLWLTQLRLERGLCVHTVAAALGINPGRISELETGKRDPKPGELCALLQFYGRLPD